MPGLGHKSYVQFARENTYGTYETATKRMEIVSQSIAPSIGIIRDPSLNDQPSRRGLYEGGKLWRGSIVTRQNYSGAAFLHLWDAAFGTATYGAKGAVTTGTGPYTHAFKELQLVNSLSLELGLGDVPAGKVFRVLGSKITGATTRFTAGQGQDAMLQTEWQVLATDMVSDQTPTGALSAPAIAPVLYHQATIVDDGVNTSLVRLRAAEISLTNNLSEDRFYAGSKNILEPIRNDFLAPTMRMTLEFDTKTVYDAARNFTTGSPELRFGDGTNFLRFRMSEANIVDFSAPIAGYGVIVATVTWEGYRSGSNADSSALFVEVVSGDDGTVLTTD